jgi:hypothetical protein
MWTKRICVRVCQCNIVCDNIRSNYHQCVNSLSELTVLFQWLDKAILHLHPYPSWQAMRKSQPWQARRPPTWGDPRSVLVIAPARVVTAPSTPRARWTTTCAWNRRVPFQPPAASAERGRSAFLASRGTPAPSPTCARSPGARPWMGPVGGCSWAATLQNRVG